MNMVRLQCGVCLVFVAALLLAAATACSGEPEAAPLATAVATASVADAAIPQTASRAIRVAVTFSRTHHFIDKGQERGLTYESLKLLENDLARACGLPPLGV